MIYPIHQIIIWIVKISWKSTHILFPVILESYHGVKNIRSEFAIGVSSSLRESGIVSSTLGVSIRLNGSVSIFLFGFLFNRLYAEGNRTEPIFFRFFDLKTEI